MPVEEIVREFNEKLRRWTEVMNAVVDSHHELKNDPRNSTKLETYRENWNKALEKAETIDDIDELSVHLPYDAINDIDTNASEKIRSKWIELFTEELPKIAHEPYTLSHIYRNAHFDESKKMALDAFIASITTEEGARHFHNAHNTNNEVKLALEEKFPELFPGEKEDTLKEIQSEEEDFRESKQFGEEEDDDDDDDEENGPGDKFMNSVMGL